MSRAPAAARGHPRRSRRTGSPRARPSAAQDARNRTVYGSSDSRTGSPRRSTRRRGRPPWPRARARAPAGVPCPWHAASTSRLGAATRSMPDLEARASRAVAAEHQAPVYPALPLRGRGRAQRRQRQASSTTSRSSTGATRQPTPRAAARTPGRPTATTAAAPPRSRRLSCQLGRLAAPHRRPLSALLDSPRRSGRGPATPSTQCMPTRHPERERLEAGGALACAPAAERPFLPSRRPRE